MVTLSIVTGTYNRLESGLKRFVDSVRRSIGIGISYEIILVDGGSIDGTIEWCKQQPDVILIEQGKLLGAVKAFNAGFERASGKYVVAANDDIEFVDESLVSALVFMEENPDVGCGCFWQDRNGREWHVEYMPAIVDGQQVSHIYGQVAIYPKWLGDRVGWWGNYLHTYGGDNELSCHILELGYKIRAVPCACIHDFQIVDDLRRHNLDVYKSPEQAAKAGVPHSDSTTWGTRWTHRDGPNVNMCGPVVKTAVQISNPLKSEKRIFYAPIFEPGHIVQKLQKRGLRNALSNVGLVYEYDYMKMSADKGKKYCVDYVFDLANSFKPNMFLFQIQGTGEFTAEVMRELRGEHPNAVFVNWNGDYHPEVLFDKDYIELLKQFHLTGLVTTQVVEKYQMQGVSWFYWQIGYEESDANADRSIRDVVFLGNGYSGRRKALGEFLVGLRELGYSIGLFGSWPQELGPDGNTLYDFDAGCSIYRSARLAVSDNQWGLEATGFVSNRLFQAMAAGGAMLLQQRMDGLDLLGLRDGVHLVVWDDLDDLHDKIEYFVHNPDERVGIAEVGTDEVLRNHSFDVRAVELLRELNVRGIEW